MKIFLLSVLLSVVFADPTVYLNEEFLTGEFRLLLSISILTSSPLESYKSQWIESTFKGNDQGKFAWSAGKFFNDAEKDKGIQTSQDAKFYGISTKFATPFSNEGKKLVIQFQVKHEQTIDCGGGYLKVMGADIDQVKFQGETPYHIMFGKELLETLFLNLTKSKKKFHT